MEGYIGILFMHGIHINGGYVPGAMTIGVRDGGQLSLWT